MPADSQAPPGPESLDEIFGEDPPAPAWVPDRIARLYVVGVPLIFCGVLTAMSLVPRGDNAAVWPEASGAAVAGLLAALAGGGVGGFALYFLLRRPRGIGPSHYAPPAYMFGGLLGLMAYILVAGAVGKWLSASGWGNSGQLLASAVGWIPAVVVAATLEQHGPRPAIRLAAPLAFAAWIPVILLLIPVGILNVALLDVCGLGAPPQAVMSAFQQAPSVPERILFVISVCAVAPFCEELIFRGVLYRGMRDTAGKIPAVIGSALLFTAIHLTPTHAMGIFTVGCVLALLYERTGTIVAPMVLHATHNTLALFGAEYLG